MEYLEKLKQLTAWDIEPALSDDDLDELLKGAALEDTNGLTPNHEAWTPTYDLYAAAAQAWLVKASRSAAVVDTPEAGMVTSKVFDNCRTMARIYAAKGRTSALIR